LPAFNVLAMTVSPSIFEFGGDPGNVLTQTIKIFNETGSPVDLYTSAADFTAKEGEEGSPEFLPPVGENIGLSSWIEIESGPITVMPLEHKTVSFAINIPQNADPGGHYAAVFFATQAPQTQGSAVGLAGKLGALVLLTVSGDINESGRIVEFGLKNPKMFYDRLPVEFSLLFENSGTVHLKPQGEITITNFFGQTADSILFNREEVTGGKNVLPDTRRHLDAVWTRGPMESENNNFLQKANNEIANFALGRYRADLVFAYGTQGQIARASAVFWVFPWHLMLVLAVAAGILIFLAIAAIRGYNNWIVKRALKEMNRKK